MARLSLRFPEIMDLLVMGKLNLLAICLIEPHMTVKNGLKNGKKLIEQAIGKTKEELEYLLANQFQKIEKTEDRIRRLPVIRRVVSVNTNTHPQSMRDIPKNIFHALEDRGHLIGPTVGQKSTKHEQTQTIEIRRVKLECVVDEAVAKKLERAKDLLRVKYPKGGLNDILNEALDALLDKKDPSRKLFRKKSAPISQNKTNQNKLNQNKETTTRHIPAPIRRQVWQRDTGQCSYKSPNGKRCGERGNLHLDHVRPFALGGKHSKENLRLLCRTHNLYRAQQTFGISQRY